MKPKHVAAERLNARQRKAPREGEATRPRAAPKPHLYRQPAGGIDPQFLTLMSPFYTQLPTQPQQPDRALAGTLSYGVVPPRCSLAVRPLKRLELLYLYGAYRKCYDVYVVNLVFAFFDTLYVAIPAR